MNSSDQSLMRPDGPEAALPGGFHPRPAGYDLHHESYSVAEAAALLGIAAEVIHHAISNGELDALRVGHSVIAIHRTALLAWLDARGPGV